MSNLETLYERYKKSAGVTDDPKNPPKNSVYFSLKYRKPNTKAYLFVWHSWRMMELYAPFLRRWAAKFGQKTRYAADLTAALDRRYDGNGYAAEAVGNGAAFAVIDNPAKHNPPKTMLVENATDAVYALARHHRQAIDKPIVAITGTMGKTTTTNLIHAVLKTELKPSVSVGRNDPHGQSFNVLNMPGDCDVGVFEMGTVRPTIIRSSCEISRPTHGLITAVDFAHLDTFGDLDTIKRSKWELFDFLLKNDGQIFLNMNHAWLASQAHRVPSAIKYGASADCDVVGEIVSADPYLKIRWLPKAGESLEIQSNLAGTHNFDNLMAAIAVGLEFGVSPSSIKAGIEAFRPITDRSEIFYSGTNMIYNETFSTTPASTMANLRSFSQFSASPKILVLGPLSRTPLDHPSYQNLIDLLQELQFDQVILLSERYDRFKHLNIGLHMNGGADVKKWLSKNRPENGAIMIKTFSGYGLKNLFPQN